MELEGFREKMIAEKFVDSLLDTATTQQGTASELKNRKATLNKVVREMVFNPSLGSLTQNDHTSILTAHFDFGTHQNPDMVIKNTTRLHSLIEKRIPSDDDDIQRHILYTRGLVLAYKGSIETVPQLFSYISFKKLLVELVRRTTSIENQNVHIVDEALLTNLHGLVTFIQNHQNMNGNSFYTNVELEEVTPDDIEGQMDTLLRQLLARSLPPFHQPTYNNLFSNKDIPIRRLTGGIRELSEVASNYK